MIATVQVPFVRGGAELLAESLKDALLSKGHTVDIINVPFKWYPPERILDHILASRLLDITEVMGQRVDRVIGLKFPAYFVPHPNKVVWILHQHRTAYDLWDHPLGDLIHYPEGAQIRDAIHSADRQLLREAKAIFTISLNVSRRLKEFCAIDSTPLYHPPPHADQFYCSIPQDYLFFPSRLNRLKRQELVIQALAQTKQPVRVIFAGTADEPLYEQSLKVLARRVGVHRRVRWEGYVEEQEKRRLYAECLGVIFPPIDEDYGYVTLEAMLSCKPVITCTDSGGVLEFVRPDQTGLIVEPRPDCLADALDRLWRNPKDAVAMGKAGKSHYESVGISWGKVVKALVD